MPVVFLQHLDGSACLHNEVALVITSTQTSFFLPAASHSLTVLQWDVIMGFGNFLRMGEE
jgi:hypothetical protein